METIRILIADDHELVREGLKSILTAGHPDWEIVAEASNGSDALELGLQLRPTVAILDLSMPGLNGMQVTEQLTGKLPGIRVLVLTMHAGEPVMRQLKRAGAAAYLLKSEAPSKLLRSVERMLAGESFFASDDAYRPANAVESPEFIPVQYLLTPRELEVMKSLASGRSNKELAGDLNVSVRTAESHRASIMEKLGVESLGEMVRVAVRDGIV